MRLEDSKVYRPTRAIIDLKALEYNYISIKERLREDIGILAVVKADAYGHGAVEVVRRLEALGCSFLGVALCEEGIELRRAGIKTPILILGGFFEGEVGSIIDFNLTPLIFDSRSATLLHRYASKVGKVVRAHLKVDTGMGRLGVVVEELPHFLKALRNYKNIELEGLLSHFSEAEKEEKGYSLEQLKKFNKAIDLVLNAGFNPKYIHIANSAAILNIPSSLFNLVRPGILLYGSYPSERFKSILKVKPVLTLVTEVLQLKKVSKGSPISYGRDYVTARDSLIATIPIGYGDGFPRSLSNRGQALVRGKRVPIVGRICMDLTMLDVTDCPQVEVGDEVVLIGGQGEDRITVEEVAEKAGTISYEILCGITSRVRREYL